MLAFTEHDLAASAQAYDPAVHEAPLVVGHPAHDAPAYGWVKKLAFAEGGLHAEPEQVDAAFAELVEAGRFKKISASFYPPESAQNPVPGVYYLRHVGFLGAQPPAIKGLKQVAFADADDCITIEFSDYDDMTIAGLFRGLREWIIGQFGSDEADKVLPSYAVQQLEQSATEELAKEQTEMDGKNAILPNPSFSEPGDTMAANTTEAISAEELEALKAENAALKQQQLDFAEQQQRDNASRLHNEHVSFCENLIKEGRLLPAQKYLQVAIMDHLRQKSDGLEFGEGDAKKPLFDAYKEQLSQLPKVVGFGEHYADNGSQTDSVDFASPDGLPVDNVQLQLHQNALAYAKTHNTDYRSALLAVAKR